MISNWRRRCAAATVTLSAAVSAGFSLQAVLHTHGTESLAMYGASRSVVLFGAAIGAWGAPVVLPVLALIMTLVQLLDAVIGLQMGDPGKTLGPLLLAALTGLGWFWLRGDQRAEPTDRG